MKFAIVVNEGPFQRQASSSAYEFVRAALAEGHEIHRVFFYHDGVYNGTRLSVPPSDEPDPPASWAALARDHGVDLVVCVAAAQRRGMLDAASAVRLHRDGHNLADGFRMSGLGQLIESGLDADRVLVFGD